ncbi:hypothetical protein KAX02_01275 [candidate division WOR-3 bacterium]|nr:hypothetical protein [candidate division WOR-3 bacterium]
MRIFNLFPLFLCTLKIFAGSIDTSEIFYEFHQNDNSYSFTGRFFTNVSPGCLIFVLFDFEHLIKFVTSADSIELLDYGENWQDVRYTYKGFLFESKTTYRRTLKQERQKILFKMTACKQSGLPLPKPLSSKGYYEIKTEEDGCWVEYFQEAELESNLLQGFYLRRVKKEAIQFLEEFRDYVNRTCK